MNGCGSLFSCIAAVICDPKGGLKKAYCIYLHVAEYKKTAQRKGFFLSVVYIKYITM